MKLPAEISGGIKVVLTKTGGRLPQSGALLRIYKANCAQTIAAVYSDTLGRAMVLLPFGQYDLRVTKSGYNAVFFKNICVQSDHMRLIEWDCIHKRADPLCSEYIVDMGDHSCAQQCTKQADELPADIRRLQELMNSACAHIDEIPYLTVDGVYGVITKNAVKAFQRFYGLEVSGIVDEETWKRLNRP